MLPEFHARTMLWTIFRHCLKSSTQQIPIRILLLMAQLVYSRIAEMMDNIGKVNDAEDLVVLDDRHATAFLLHHTVEHHHKVLLGGNGDDLRTHHLANFQVLELELVEVGFQFLAPNSDGLDFVIHERRLQMVNDIIHGDHPRKSSDPINAHNAERIARFSDLAPHQLAYRRLNGRLRVKRFKFRGHNVPGCKLYSFDPSMMP